jgi:hypothetical protein
MSSPHRTELGKEDQGVLNAIKGVVKDAASGDPSSYSGTA